MPIEVDSKVRIFSEDEFHALAHRVMGIVFDVHNDLGRLMEEQIYQQAIRRRCELAGIVPARHEVEIKVRYKDFQKSYFMDLLFECGLMVESKTVEVLNNAHHAQTLHYLLLTGMRHGLLVNLRPAKVNKRTIYDGNAALATHEACLIADDTAVVLTALKDGNVQMEDHLQKFLSHTNLASIQWLNMDNHNIEFRTLEKTNGRIMGAE